MSNPTKGPQLQVLILPILTLLMLAGPARGFSGPDIGDLRVEYLREPIGIDVDKPHFSWKMTAADGRRGLVQEAYRIVVSDEQDNRVWDSGKVGSGLALGIAYQGKPLNPGTRYAWNLTVWDREGQPYTGSSWFETGLMDPNPNAAAWGGAQWIGTTQEDLPLCAQYLSMFRLQYGLALDQASGSTRAAFVFGANDRRLLDKNRNLLGMQNKKDQGYMALELDISGLGAGKDGKARLNIYRVGYAPGDRADQPFKSYEIPTTLVNDGNKYDRHQFYVECNFGVFNIYMDGSEEANKITRSGAQDSPFVLSGLMLNPYGDGPGGDYLSFPMLADIGFVADQGQTARFSDIRVRHYRRPSNVIFSESTAPGEAYAGIFRPFLDKRDGKFAVAEGAYVVSGAGDGVFAVADPGRNAAPMLRTEFETADKAVKKARLYVTARGIYEVYLNGRRVGNDYFNPGLTQYNKTQMYQTYDVTDGINRGGGNALGAWLSEGWWSGNITYRGENWNYFGDRQSLLAKLVITYADGTEKVIVSNDQDWKYTADGPIRYGSFFQGEVYDATKEAAVSGWSTSSFDDRHWETAVRIPLEGTAVTGSFKDFLGRDIQLNYDQQQLVGQIGENVRIVKTMTAQSVEEVRPGIFVYDMGQNMVGFPTLSIRGGNRGDTVTLRYAEVRYPDLPEYKENTGMIMIENIRAALTQDLYVLKGGDETIQPRFTFHGYRFVEITGIPRALAPEDVKGQVLSSVYELASQYETSNPLVTKLWENISWSMRSNFLSIPTDTPARNERMGWSGDISVFSRASTYLANVNEFFKRHLLAMRDMQGADGKFTDVAPVGGGFGGILWGSAGITVAWEAYQQYGDLSLLRDHYPAMKAYMTFLDTRIDSATGLLNEGPLGDWLSPENNKNNDTQIWTAYHLYDLDIMTKAAALLGKQEDADLFRKRYADRKRFFNEVFVDKGTHKTISSALSTGFMRPTAIDPTVEGKPIDTQASYAIPLAFGVFDEASRAGAVEHLAETVTRQNTDDEGMLRPAYSLMTGFIGTAYIGEALSENGRDDLAYRLLQQETYPSWLYPVVNGATTIWERLNSYTIENGFGGNNRMNSFNHYAFGAVASWMYNYSLGIQRDPEQPAFKRFVLKPTPDPTGRMTWAKGYYDSMYGRIASEWRMDNGKLTYKTTVPPNTSARLYLPAGSVKQVRESGKKVKKAKGVKYLSKAGDRLVFELGSGEFEFVIGQ